MKKRRLVALMVLTSAPALVFAAPSQDAALGTPVSEATLSEYRGAQNTTFNLQNTEAQLNDTTATHNISGTNQISGGAFAGSNGLPTVIQNSGNNVVIQNATIVNVKLQ